MVHNENMNQPSLPSDILQKLRQDIRNLEGFKTGQEAILSSRLLMVEGTLEKEGEVIHVVSKKFHDLTRWLKSLSSPAPELPLLPPQADKEILPKARNFK